MSMTELQTKFLQIYANLPLSQRNEIVIVVDSEPLTWNAVNIEVQNNTTKSIEILQKLVNLGIINEK